MFLLSDRSLAPIYALNAATVTLIPPPLLLLSPSERAAGVS